MGLCLWSGGSVCVSSCSVSVGWYVGSQWLCLVFVCVCRVVVGEGGRVKGLSQVVCRVLRSV